MGVVPGSQETELDQHYDVVIAACEKLLADSNGMEAIIVNTKSLTLASTQFVAALKHTANECEDEDEKRRLVNAAKNLAAATSAMVANAKEAARATSNTSTQQSFRVAVEDLKKNSNAAAGPQLRDRAMYKLSKAVKVLLYSYSIGHCGFFESTFGECKVCSAFKPKPSFATGVKSGCTQGK